MQQYDGKPGDEIDGSPPDPYSPPSWLGTLVMLAVIVVFLGLIALWFFSWVNSAAGQEFHIPGL
jgi:hypothetical protein